MSEEQLITTLLDMHSLLPFPKELISLVVDFIHTFQCSFIKSLPFQNSYRQITTVDNGEIFVVKNCQKDIQVFSAKNGSLLRTLPTDTEYTQCILVKDGFVVKIHSDGFDIYDKYDGKLLRSECIISCYGSCIIDDTIFIMDKFVKRILIYSLSNSRKYCPLGLDFFPEMITTNGKELIIMDQHSQKIVYIDPKTGKIVKSWELDVVPNFSAKQIFVYGEELIIIRSPKITAYSQKDGSIRQEWVFTNVIQGIGCEKEKLYIADSNGIQVYE